MPTNDYVKFVKDYLSTGPKLSSAITDAIEEKFKISKKYARTVLNRMNSNDELYHTGNLRFSSGQRGYSLSSNHNSFYPLLEEKPRLKITVDLLSANKVVSKLELLKYSGIINLENTNYYDLTKLIKDLEFFFPDINFFEINGDTYYSISNFITEENIDEFYKDRLNQRIIDLRVLPLAISYCKKINLIGNKARYVSVDYPLTWIETRAQLAFDAVSFTKIGNNDSNSTICVFDVSISNYNESQYQGFKYRYKTLMNSTKVYKQRVIPILIIDNIFYGLEKRIRSDNEVIIIKLSNVFGSRITRFLEILKAHELGNLSNVSELIEVIKNTYNAKQLSRFIPFGFELVVNATFNQLFATNSMPMSLRQVKLKIGKIEKQFDGFFEDEQNLYFIETKLYTGRSKITWFSETSKGKLSKECLKYFFVEKYKFIKDWARANGKNKNISMCFVSSNGFYKIDEGMKTIDKAIQPIKGLPLTVTIDYLIDYAKNKNIPIKELKDWIEMYYSKDDEKESEEDNKVDEEEIEDGVTELSFNDF